MIASATPPKTAKMLLQTLTRTNPRPCLSAGGRREGGREGWDGMGGMEGGREGWNGWKERMGGMGWDGWDGGREGWDGMGWDTGIVVSTTATPTTTTATFLDRGGV